MTTGRVALIGGVVGLAICIVIMILLGWGVAGVLITRHFDWMYLLWPAVLPLGVYKQTPEPNSVTDRK